MSDHVVQLRYYNDGAENPVSWRDLEGGGTGAFLQPLVARRLGQARHRVWEVRDTSPFPMDILAAAVLTDLQPGEIQLPLPDGTYRDATRPWSHQDVVNWLPCFAEAAGTRSAHKYATAPGLTTFANVGSGPHRGICDAEGVLYVVSGPALYRVAVDGTATYLGAIPGTGRVAMAYNQITNGHQLVVAAGSSGYVYDSYTDTLTQITDDGFAGFVDCDFLNQYIVGVEPQRKFWYHSELNDALSYNTLDRYPAETSPDPIVGIRASHNEVLVFGRRTIEPWVNDPENNAAATAFQLERGSVVERGCASAHTIRRLDNSIFFLGDDGMPYRLDGYTPRPIAPQALVSAWKGCKWERAFAFTFEDNGHVIYYLTFPDGQTWGYDVSASAVAGHAVWHRRQSFEFDRWRLNTLVKSNGVWYGGDFQNGKLYRVEWGNVYEGCELMPRSFKTGVLHNNGLPVAISAFRLSAATGTPRSTVDVATTGTISGDLAGSPMVGDTADYQYTLTSAYPGQALSCSVTGGALPDGLVLSSAGHVTGMYTASGSFAWTISLHNECGVLVDTLADSVTVGAVTQEWWLTQKTASAGDDDLWVTSNPLSWPTATTRSPFVEDPDLGPFGFEPDQAMVLRLNASNTSAERATNLDPSAPIAMSLVTVPAYIQRAQYIDGLLFLVQATPGKIVFATDQGASGTYTDSLAIYSGSTPSVAKIGSRWITATQPTGGGPVRFRYSDQAQPTTWSDASGDLPGSSYTHIASNGNVAVTFDNGSKCWRTTDGTNWSSFDIGTHNVSEGVQATPLAIGDVFIFPMEPAGSGVRIKRSTNAGLAWATVTIDAANNASIQRLEYDGTYLVASPTGGSKVYVSTELGAPGSWVESTLPNAGGGFLAAPVRRTT